MSLAPSQSAIIAALDATDRPRKWWCEELGTYASRLSEWAHGSREMPPEMKADALRAIARIAPEIAADVWRDHLRAFGMVVEPVARPEPAATSRRLHSAVAREFADLTEAWADADEDAHHTAPEIARRLREIRQLREKLAAYETVTAQELAAAETGAGVLELGLRMGAK